MSGDAIVIAPDSFKGALGAAEVAEAIAAGWREALPDSEIRLVPMADGGEGTARAMTSATQGTWVEVETTDPLGRPVVAGYGLLGRTEGAPDRAVIDVASASGLDLVASAERDVWRASSHGTGVLLRHALDAGVDEIVLGLGGSATNDAGAGLLEALGVRLLDADGLPVERGPRGLTRLHTVDASGLHPRVAGVRLRAACDVTNPLTGPTGASAVFGPQKGATSTDVAALDEALLRFADLVARSGRARSAAGDAGAGAAGGMGYAVRSLLGAELTSGVDLVATHVGLGDACRGARLVLTGEGRLDGQTASGKVPLGVARIAALFGAPTVALVGGVGDGYERVLDTIAGVLPIGNGPRPLDEAMAATAEDLRRTARNLAGSLCAWGP